jgi:hypothetical protein
VDEVRTRIYRLNREITIPEIITARILGTGGYMCLEMKGMYRNDQ